MNDDERTLVDGDIWMDVGGQKGSNGRTLVDGHLWMNVVRWMELDGGWTNVNYKVGRMSNKR
jgi:hypothetical protein